MNEEIKQNHVLILLNEQDVELNSNLILKKIYFLYKKKIYF